VSRPLRVGIQLPEVERAVDWPEYAAMARAAEDAGFDSIWVGDHYLYRGDGGAERGPWEAWTLLAGLAAVTRRVRLGPLVACAGFHAPTVLAKTAATVDEIAGGRLTLGIGAGWNRAEFEAFGIPFDHRASRFEEAVGVIHGLLAGERVTLHGRWFEVRDAVLLPAPAHRIPMMVGSKGPRVLAAALPLVDAWNAWFDDYGNTPAGFEGLNGRIDDACRTAGRDPAAIRRSACVHLVLDRARAGRPLQVPPLEGTPETIAAALSAFSAAGADEVILVVGPIDGSSIRALTAVLRILDER
jgi:probable F420-dependent oxidoreductase